MEKTVGLLKIIKNKTTIALLCFLTDIALSLWSYFKLTNYDEYLKEVKPLVNSPDFQVQLYQVLLQSLTFSLILFLTFHLVIYFLFWKDKKYAVKYVRFYTFMALISCILMIASKMYLAIIPAFIYGFCFTSIGKQPKSQKATS